MYYNVLRIFMENIFLTNTLPFAFAKDTVFFLNITIFKI